MSNATTKQIDYIETLARKAGENGDAWDVLGKHLGCSRSKAQKKASQADASEVIERLLKQVDAADGETVEGRTKLDGSWFSFTDDLQALYDLHRGALVGRSSELVTKRNELKSAGSATPFVDAIHALVGCSKLDSLKAERAKLVAQLAEIDEQIAARLP